MYNFEIDKTQYYIAVMHSGANDFLKTWVLVTVNASTFIGKFS